MGNNGMKLRSIFLAVTVGMIYGTGIIADDSGPAPAVKRIGTYDSRSVAIAFVGSEVYKKTAGEELRKNWAAYKKAKEAGNTEEEKKLKAWGENQQHLLHQQAFSTAPVDNILKHIADKLPEFKKQQKVDLLVSKWDKKTLDKYKSAQQQDVTLPLIELFNPNAKQKKTALEIRKHKPYPIKMIKKGMD